MQNLFTSEQSTKKRRLLLARWSVLAALVLAVGAVAIWGGTANNQAAENGGMSEILVSAWQQDSTDSNAVNDEPEIRQVSGSSMTENVNTEATPPQTAEITPTSDTPDEVENSTNIAAADSTDSTDSINSTDSADSDDDEVYDYAPEPWVGDPALAAEAALLQMLPPIDGTLSRGFGYGFDQTFADYRFHEGLDYTAQVGASVFAPIDGVISEINDDDFFGASIALTHGNKLVTRYFGITPESGLQLEQTVVAGEKLGTVAESPVFEDGMPPHLHWEVLLDNEYVNPAEYQVGD